VFRDWCLVFSLAFVLSFSSSVSIALLQVTSYWLQVTLEEGVWLLVFSVW